MNTIAKRALDTDVSIATDSALVLASVESFVATYPAAVSEPTVRYVVDSARGIVTRNGEVLVSGFRQDALAPFLERELYDSVCERAASPSFVVHAGAVVRDGRAVLLFGASGAGKTTMCRGLVGRGARYVTDEIAAIDVALRVRGLPRPLALAPEAPPDDSFARTLRGRTSGYAFVARDGTHVAARLFALDTEHIHDEPAPIAAVVHLRHAREEAAGARALRASEALKLLWEQRLRAGANELDVASALVSRAPAFELVTHDVDGACLAVDAIIGHS